LDLYRDPFEVAEAQRDLEEAKRLNAAIRASRGGKRKEPTPRQVYVLNAEGTLLNKIGVAYCAKKRLQVLQKGFPYRLWLVTVIDYDGPDIFRYERKLHKTMRNCRLQGEWFEFDPHTFLSTLKGIRARNQQQTHEDGGNAGE